MDRKERTNEKMQELFHTPAAGEEGTDPEFMQILQGYIFGDVCYTGSLDNRMRELVTITVLTTIQALPQLKAPPGRLPERGLHAGGTAGGHLPVRPVYRLSLYAERHLSNERGLPGPWDRTSSAQAEDDLLRRGAV